MNMFKIFKRRENKRHKAISGYNEKGTCKFKKATFSGIIYT